MRTACSTPLLKMERSVSDSFLKWFESTLNTFIEAKHALVNDLFKSKGSVADCITDMACVYTGNATKLFLHHKSTEN